MFPVVDKSGTSCYHLVTRLMRLVTNCSNKSAIISSLYVCMAIKYIIVLFVETPRKFITAKLSIRKPGSSSVLIIHIISTDEDPGLRIESFAVINLRGVSTNKTIISLPSFERNKLMTTSS